jgi:hypothetical protein
MVFSICDYRLAIAGDYRGGDNSRIPSLTDLILQPAAPGIEIYKRPCFCLCPFRAHLINDSVVNHLGAYAVIAGDLDMEFHGGQGALR